MAANADIFPRRPCLPPLAGRLVALHVALFALGALRISDSQRTRRELGRHRGRRRRDERDAGQQHPSAECAARGAERSGQRVEGPVAIAAQGDPKEEPKAIPIPARDAKLKGPARGRDSEERAAEASGQGGARQPDSLRTRRPGQRAVRIVHLGRDQGRIRLSGRQGDFGSRFAYYVDIVRRKVSDNWLKYEVDPRITDARRVYIYFEINRSGQPTNIRVEQSSGIPSLDQSAVRALQRIDTFGPLPAGLFGKLCRSGVLVRLSAVRSMHVDQMSRSTGLFWTRE